MFKHVWFDLDGTLINSAPAIVESFQLAFRAVGVAPARAICSDAIGPPLRETLELLAGSSDKGLVDALAAAFMESYDSVGYLGTEVFDGVGALLKGLQDSGLSMAIATNKRICPTRLILDHLGWTGYFSRIYALDSFSPRLQNKQAMLGRLLSDSGVERDSVVYVGDRLEDGLAAAGNSLSFVAASWGYGAILENELMAGWQIATTPAELADLLSGCRC